MLRWYFVIPSKRTELSEEGISKSIATLKRYRQTVVDIGAISEEENFAGIDA